MEAIILVFFAVILIILIAVLIIVNKISGSSGDPESKFRIESLKEEIGRIEYSVKHEIATNRNEANMTSKNARLELTSALKSFEEKLNHLTFVLDQKLSAFNETSLFNAKEGRKELTLSLEQFQKAFSKSVEEFNKVQQESFHALLKMQGEQNFQTSSKLDFIRETLEKKMNELQTGNERKLEEMRITVDEKLQKTLENRLGESFKLVSGQLEAVHKGLGDMQQLATGVGDLKRVLSNVKTRGVLGEYQLENILEQILTPEQYGKNIKTKEGSAGMVEFAIKLPGRGEDKDKPLWLPVDSKFPKEDFELLIEAYDKGVSEEIEERRKSFVRGIKKCASDICGKYIDPPNTTDFAILFLPFESLYAEVLRTLGLFESIQRECNIIITGPTTLSALLSSLQMGFRTLTIEKRSGEVWQILSAVKTEFSKFGVIIQKTQKKLQEASNVMDEASTRSKAIERKLKDVQELPKSEIVNILEEVFEKPDLNSTDEEVY